MTKPRYSARLHQGIGFAALVVLVGMLGTWGVFARISGAVIATGLVEVAFDRQVVEHEEGGIVSTIFVRDGDEVEAGQQLVLLDGHILGSELDILSGQYLEHLTLEARLQAESEERDQILWSDDLIHRASLDDEVAKLVESQMRLHAIRHRNLMAEAEQLATQSRQLDDQAEGLTAQLAAFESQLSLIAEELDDTRSLFEKGLSRAPQLKALEREEARIEGEIGRLKADIGQLGTRKSELEIARIRLFSSRQEEALAQLRDVEPLIDELETRFKTLSERIKRLTIKAPVSGVVFGSQVVAEKSVISAAEPILYIVPNEQPLVITARVDAVHIEQVRLGQEASLRFSTFDQRFIPELKGFIEDISADVFEDERTGQQFYEVGLDLLEGEVEKLEENKLIPGLPVEVFIQTEERSPLHYLTKPLTDYFTRAWRES